MRNLHMRLMVIMVLLVITVMSVTGFILISSVKTFFRDEFARQIEATVQDNQDFVSTLRRKAGEGDPVGALVDVVSSYAAPLGLDGLERKYYILNGRTADYLGGDPPPEGKVAITPNILSAIAGNMGDNFSSNEDFLDFALPLSNGERDFILYIYDSEALRSRQTAELFTLIVRAVLLGLSVSVILAFALSKTMAQPLERLTKGISRVASGDFAEPLPVKSLDEIGVLTKSFNNMARVLKETIEAVESERDKLRTLFQHMTDGVASFSNDGELLHMNPAAMRLLSVEHLEGVSYDEILGEITHLDELKDFKASEYLERNVTAGDKYLQVFFAPFGSENAERGIIAVIRDITEQEKLDRLRREFVSNVSHELRTPLTNVKSYAETIAEPDIPVETVAGFAKVIVNEADRMTRLVRDLLELSRFDHGKVEFTKETFSFSESVRAAYDSMLMEASKHNHKMRSEIPDGLFVEGSALRVEQVLINIIGNAIAYTPDGGEIEITCGRIADEVWCKVKDNGVGIPKKDIGHVFERFYRVDKDRSRESGGTGLGLAIAQEIVKSHDGYIDVASSGAGTVFTVVLPAADGEGI